MSGKTLSKIQSEALMLPEEERAQLAYALVKSLDQPLDTDAGDAWDKEIVRRLAEVETGTATLIDREEFRRRLQARLGRK